ncbi:MAG TPA: hypothetical protein VKY74_04025 [Chloroflexia bacterium]|nr:hypothetical protein [Chloroflexia bacterium]
MYYDIDMLQDDIQNLGEVTTGWRNYTPRPPGAELAAAALPPAIDVDPNSPEAAAYDYFLDKYGFADGPDVAARFFAIHGFIMRNLRKLDRRGLLKPGRQGPPMAEDLLRFLLTCFEEPAPDAQLPHSIYDPTGGLALPFEAIMVDFHRLRVLRERLTA